MDGAAIFELGLALLDLGFLDLELGQAGLVMPIVRPALASAEIAAVNAKRCAKRSWFRLYRNSKPPNFSAAKSPDSFIRRE